MAAAVRRDVVVIGASAGGVETLMHVVGSLPSDLPAAVCVVLHVAPTGMSVLPAILARAGRLPADHAVDGDPLEPGRIYVAPPNNHLLLTPGHVAVTRGPKENGHRPAIDPLFRTAARTYGPRVAGVVLSGSLDDGTTGLRTIKICGGATLVQDPRDALYPSMPRSAIEHVRPDYVLAAEDLGRTIASLARGAAGPAPLQEVTMDASDEPHRPGGSYTCPDCGGALEEIEDEGLVRFRCKVGHAYSQDSLLFLQSEQLESALWAALRSLQDRAELTTRIADRLRVRGGADSVARRFERQAEDAGRHATTLREMLDTVEAIDQPDPAAGVAEA